ncbi:MAG: tRNA preQ1(34) S-adenosylmethionine ribosyltransferase-isomerase QueA [Planctomycetes bacterium]|nr:tRNA preQ1(34) S-adenosylmethionine ribosyltransferase-isomerase QueA [Planctomycetota bacterium]
MDRRDFWYDLPKERIAQRPVEPRDASRLLVVDRSRPDVKERAFRDLPALLAPGDLLVINDTRVFRARLRARRRTGGAVEVLLIAPDEDGGWRALLSPDGKVREGEALALADGRSIVAGPREDRMGRRVAFADGASGWEIAEALGETPLPPYIRRPGGELPLDAERYQTVFAREPGAVAAPTAGLHFTPALLDAVRARGVGIARITLHVGPGTFLPIRADQIEDHRVDPEHADVPAEVCRRIAETRAAEHRVVAVGTTVVRSLETAARRGSGEGFRGWTDLFIHPPFDFRWVDAIVTNFHLPESSLLVLVAAFAGRERILAAYDEAIRRGFRFYSYGDAMVIL